MALPWDDVKKGIDSREVATLLGLPEASSGETDKYGGCPGCATSDALHAYAPTADKGAGFFCYSEWKMHSNVDVAAYHWGCAPWEACVRLAHEFGIPVDENDITDSDRNIKAPTYIAPRPKISAAEQMRIDLEALKGPRYPHEVWADLIQQLTLTEPAKAFLRDVRGIERLDSAEEYGFRGVTEGDGLKVFDRWQQLDTYLQRMYRPAELRAAGFPYLPEDKLAKLGFKPTDKRLELPYLGFKPALLIPYKYQGKIIGMRWANIAEDRNEGGSKKYLYLKGISMPPMPFNADAFGSRTIHVVEGEFNAYVLSMYPYGKDAIGTGSAGNWKDEWTTLLLKSHRIVAWYDTDEAGNRGYAKLRQRIAAEIGEEEADKRLYRMTDLPPKLDGDGKPLVKKNKRTGEEHVIAMDPNELHLANQLAPILKKKPWFRSLF